MLEGALILLAGILIGRLWPVPRKGPKPVQAVCGCKHHHSMHDPETGACNARERGNPLRWAGNGNPVEWDWLDCPCLCYSGPEPLPTLFAPEIAEG